jgi:Fic family protein
MEEVLETPSRMEPCLLDEVGGPLPDLVADLTFASARLGTRLHPDSAAGLVDLVRVMNCYYSNLIEGHNTTPRDIERALVNQLDDTEERRNLQLEAQAHIRVQAQFDRQNRAGTLPEPASVGFIQMLHAEFYRDASDSVLKLYGHDRR